MYVFVKRVFDVMFSLIFMFILLPIFIILIVLIKIKLGSPVIFKQKRPGKDCRIFTMYKFRSMTDAKDLEGNLLSDEERLTEFGKKLRNTSLDELPELLNIFKGEMSFVGPRPQLIRDMVFFNSNQMKRQSLIPGLTGLAQVNGRNNISWEEKIDYDLNYIENMWLGIDLKIMFKTFLKVFKAEDVSTKGMATAEDFGDYLLRTGIIDLEEYEHKQVQAKEIEANS